MANPTEGMDPAFQAQFAQIRQTFVKGLAARMQAIAQASAPASEGANRSQEADPHQRADLHTDLHMELHRLAGAAGGYGFDALSALARQAMQAAESGTPAALQDALQQLQAAVQAVAVQHGCALP